MDFKIIWHSCSFETFVQVGWQWRSNEKMVINRACPDYNLYIMHGFQNNLAQLFIWNICSGRLKVKATLEGRMIKWLWIELVWAITSSFTCMYGFQNNLAQLFIWNICLGKLKVKVTLEGQTIKWSLASVHIINWNFWFINIKKKSLVSKHDVVWLLSNKWVNQFFTCL